ncbi:YeiH family protein [Eubacteriales bacterium KG127]
MKTLRELAFWKAFILLLIISFLGKYISSFPGLNVIGHLVIALILGMMLQLFSGLHRVAKGGSAFIANKFLRVGIIMLGFKLNLDILAANGVKTLGLAMLVIAFTITLIYLIATKIFKIDSSLALLSASGCGICGAAAVLGLSPCVDTDEDDEVISVAIVAILGTIFTLFLVLVRSALDISDIQFGAWAGLSLHEIAHAVAAGNAGGPKSVNMATLVKLSRVLMLAPLSLLLAYFSSRGKGEKKNIKAPIPWFMFGFILASVIGTYVGFVQSASNTLVNIGYILLGMAMAALGANVHFDVILKKGQKMFLVAFMGSICLSGFAFVLANIFF